MLLPSELSERMDASNIGQQYTPQRRAPAHRFNAEEAVTQSPDKKASPAGRGRREGIGNRSSKYNMVPVRAVDTVRRGRVGTLQHHRGAGARRGRKRKRVSEGADDWPDSLRDTVVVSSDDEATGRRKSKSPMRKRLKPGPKPKHVKVGSSSSVAAMKEDSPPRRNKAAPKVQTPGNKKQLVIRKPKYIEEAVARQKRVTKRVEEMNRSKYSLRELRVVLSRIALRAGVVSININDPDFKKVNLSKRRTKSGSKYTFYSGSPPKTGAVALSPSQKRIEMLKRRWSSTSKDPSHPFACGKCGQTFASTGGRARHIMKHLEKITQNDLYDCEECGRTFATAQGLGMHSKTHPARKKPSGKAISTGSEGKPHKCNVCGSAFSLKAHLENHMLIHSKVKAFKCDVCDKRFPNKSCLVLHSRVHAKERPFQCSKCHKSFALKINLVVHMRGHKQDKPFKCTLCKARFSKKNELSAHSKSAHKKKTKPAGKGDSKDDNEHPFSCSTCGAGFKLKCGLISHEKTHSSAKAFRCTKCSASFPNQGQLNSHKKLHAEKQKFHCRVCMMGFESSYQLSIHLTKHRKASSSNESSTSGKSEAKKRRSRGDDTETASPSKKRVKTSKMREEELKRMASGYAEVAHDEQLSMKTKILLDPVDMSKEKTQAEKAKDDETHASEALKVPAETKILGTLTEDSSSEPPVATQPESSENTAEIIKTEGDDPEASGDHLTSQSADGQQQPAGTAAESSDASDQQGEPVTGGDTATEGGDTATVGETVTEHTQDSSAVTETAEGSFQIMIDSSSIPQQAVEGTSASVTDTENVGMDLANLEALAQSDKVQLVPTSTEQEAGQQMMVFELPASQVEAGHFTLQADGQLQFISSGETEGTSEEQQFVVGVPTSLAENPEPVPAGTTPVVVSGDQSYVVYSEGTVNPPQDLTSVSQQQQGASAGDLIVTEPGKDSNVTSEAAAELPVGEPLHAAVAEMLEADHGAEVTETDTSVSVQQSLTDITNGSSEQEPLTSIPHSGSSLLEEAYLSSTHMDCDVAQPRIADIAEMDITPSDSMNDQ